MEKKSEEAKTCFVICPIGEKDSPTREWSDIIFEWIIKPVTEKMGYTTFRASDLAEPGIITGQIVQNLIDSDLVIADLTFGNPNVFYELAIRHVTKRPCIHMIKSGDRIPFDIAANRTISLGTDIRTGQQAKDELEKQIHAIHNSVNEVDNPIGNAITLQNLKSSGDKSQVAVAEIMEEVRSLRSEVRSLRTETDSSNNIMTLNPKFHKVSFDNFYSTNKNLDTYESTVSEKLARYRVRLDMLNDELARAQYELSAMKKHGDSKKVIALKENEIGKLMDEISDLQRFL